MRKSALVPVGGDTALSSDPEGVLLPVRLTQLGWGEVLHISAHDPLCCIFKELFLKITLLQAIEGAESQDVLAMQPCKVLHK